VPVPRGSFAMGAPPPEEAGSTKSRELYGNRVAALGKGRPTAPGNACQRAVTSPAAPSTSPTSRNSPDDKTSESAAQLTPDPICDSACPPTSPSPNDYSNVTNRPVGLPNATDGDDEAQGTAVHLAAGAQLDSPTGAQDANSSEPSKTNTNSTSPTSHLPPSVSKSSSSTGFVVTILTPGDVSSTQRRATSSEDTPTHTRRPTTSTTSKASLTPAETDTQERSPVVNPKTDVPTVQPHVAVGPVPVKETTISANSRGFRLDRPPQKGSLATSSIHSVPSSVTQLPSLNIISSADNFKEGSTSSITSDAFIPNKIKTIPSSSSPSASSNVPPSNVSSTGLRVSGDLDEPTTMSPPPVAEPGRRSFSAVVHRGDGDNGSDPRHSTTSRSSTITPRPSTSSFKTGTDGGVVRSKRNFKHLGTVAVEPPPSPGMGDLGVGDLAALLQEAAWLEQRLFDENTTLGEESQKAENSAPSPTAATKGGQVTAPAPAVTTSSRTKGRGLTLGSLTSAPSSYTSQSPIRSSPSTPSFQVHTDAPPTQPKSGRGRKYFSLRGAFRGPRLSMSSEMSSDDSAPVATPPSPSFDLQATQGHGNDSMSIRSMFSIRSNKSGKSDSAPGSLRLSPRRGMSRASSFAERLLNRASKTKSMLDDPGETFARWCYFRRADSPFTFQDDTISERSPMLPPIIPETPGSLLDIAPMSSSPNNDRPFDRDIFDAFPNVPSEIPQRPASYLFPVPPKTAPPVEQNFRHSSTIGITTTQNGGRDKLGWLRS